MRTSALLTLFFSFFLFIELALSIPLSTPALVYTSGTRDILGSQNKRVMDPVTGTIGMFLRMLGRPGLHEMQLEIDDYCSKFPCPTPRETSES
ncbi:hypothetical protein BDR06DRAFT_957852 [Suillus hirtellus]|nr:hypothetical protein BDR06DRAFT_957852 [Suillus hirtellus]